MGKEDLQAAVNCGTDNEVKLPIENQESEMYARPSLDKEAGLAVCRVCQCSESDKRGDAALGFLGITPPLPEVNESNGKVNSDNKETPVNDEYINTTSKKAGRRSGVVELISPDGDVFICNTDLEMGSGQNQDALIELGCACKNDLALVHYACALKWFINHGSTVCEICGHVAKNIRTADFKKIVVSLKDYEALRERTVSGEPNPAQVHASAGVDPDAVAAIRRQRLSEISLWFSPHNNNNISASAAASQVVSDQPLNSVAEDVIPAENRATKWAVEGTGILLATGLLTVTLAWLIAPRVGKVI